MVSRVWFQLQREGSMNAFSPPSPSSSPLVATLSSALASILQSRAALPEKALSERDLQTRGPLIVATLLPLSMISTIFAVARLIVRGVIVKRIQLDDGVIAASLASMWTATATALTAVSAGHGRHLSSLSPSDTERVMRLITVSFAFGIFSFALPKFAVVSLICRLLNPSRWQRVFLWVLVGFCFVVLFGNIPSIFSQCQPARAAEVASEGRGVGGINYVTKSCIWPNESVYYSVSSSAISAITNMYLALYVALAVPRLSVGKRKKAALAFSLALGFVAFVTAIYKCTRLLALAGTDVTYDAADLVIWTAVEASTVIVAASIPVLQPLVDDWREYPWARRVRSRSPATSGFRPRTQVEYNDSHEHERERQLGSYSITKPTNPFIRLQKLRSPETNPISLLSTTSSPAASSSSRPRSIPPADVEANLPPNAIEVEREIEVNYTWERNGLALPGGWVPEDSGESLKVTKDVGADGRVTTTVAVVRSALHRPREGRRERIATSLESGS